MFIPVSWYKICSGFDPVCVSTSRKYVSTSKKVVFYRCVSASVNYVSTTRKIVLQVKFDGFTSKRNISTNGEK